MLFRNNRRCIDIVVVPALVMVYLAVSAKFSHAQTDSHAQSVLTQKTWEQLRRAPVATDGLDKPLSLHEALQIAKKNSGGIVLAGDKLRAAAMVYRERKGDILPPLSLTFNVKEGIHNPDSPPATFRGMGFQFKSDFPIYDGFAKMLELEKAKYKYQQVKQEKDRSEDQLGYAVRLAYYQLAEISILKEMQQELAIKLEGLAAKAKDLKEKGLLKPLEWTQIQLILKETQGASLALNQEYLLRQLAMKQILHVYPDHPLTVQTNLPYTEPPIRLDQSLRLAYLHNPTLAHFNQESQIVRMSRDIQRANNGVNVSVNAAVGIRGEDRNSAIEGIQTRLDATMGLKVSIPFGPQHTIRYEPNFSEQVKDLGQSTPTDYNEHEFIFDAFGSTADQTNLEADILYEDKLADLETARKRTAVDIGDTILRIEQARQQMARAQFNANLSQQRLKILLSQAQQGTQAAIVEELMGNIAATNATKAFVSSQYNVFSQVTALNQIIGVDGYWDPHAGTVTEPIAPLKVSRDKAWYKIWRDPMLDGDKDVLNASPYEDYLRPPNVLISWEDFLSSDLRYPLLHIAPEYPRIEFHGESRTRMWIDMERADLGANPQTAALFVDNTLTKLTRTQTQIVDPADTVFSNYLAWDDSYWAMEERFLGTMEVKWNRDIQTYVTMKTKHVVFSGHQTPRERSLDPFRPEYFETVLEELFLKHTDFLTEGLTLRVGRQFLDFDLGFFFNDFAKNNSLDLAQLDYRKNPWEFNVFYIHPTEDKQSSPFLLVDSNDFYGGFVRYKADTWRFMIGHLGSLDQNNFVAPQSFLGQLLWDPIPLIETEASVAYQVGKLAQLEDQHLSALSMDLRAKYKSHLPLYPQFQFRFLLGQGSKNQAVPGKDAVILANSEEFGYIMQALLANKYILNSRISLQLTKNSTLTFDHWYFSQYRARPERVSDPRINSGGIRLPTNGEQKDLGNEFVATHEVALLDNLKSQMYLAAFIPGHAYGFHSASNFPGTQWDEIPFEMRWQITYSF